MLDAALNRVQNMELCFSVYWRLVGIDNFLQRLKHRIYKDLKFFVHFVLGFNPLGIKTGVSGILSPKGVN